MSDTDQYPDADRGFEIRVSPDQRRTAIYDPGNAPWFVPVDQGHFVRTHELDEAGWVQYVPATERDGLLAVLSEVRSILTKWDRPYAGGHATNCVMAVAELQRLLNPDHTPEEP